MSQSASDPAVQLRSRKRKASVEADRIPESRDAKALRICPRSILESLSKWRIQPSAIEFPENGTRKQGASANVERANLVLSPTEKLIYSHDTLCVAVKSFRFGDNRDSERVLASLAHEISLTSELRNHNVIQLIGFAENVEEDIAWIILPWLANGNVREFLELAAWEIPERVSLIYDISCGIEYLHVRKPPICHGDLKSANILVNSRNRAVITDFGSARFLEEPTSSGAGVQKPAFAPPKPRTNDKRGLGPKSPRVELQSLGTLVTLTGTAWTLRWAAPELLNDERPGLASDIWAFSWICWEVMTGALPFHDQANSVELTHRLATLDFNLPPISSHEDLLQIEALYNLMNMCWSVDVDARPGVSVCLSKITSMSRVIPSARKCQGINDARSTELLQALGSLDRKDEKAEGEIKHLNEALHLARSREDKPGIAGSLLGLGEIQYVRRDYAAAEALSTEARVIYDEIGDQPNVAIALMCTGNAQHSQKHFSQAHVSYMEAQAIYNRVGDEFSVANASLKLGETQGFMKQFAEAEASYIKARDIYAKFGDKLAIAKATQELGEIQVLKQDYSSAEGAYTKVGDIYARIGDQLGVANASQRCGEIQLLQKTYNRAEASYTKARTIFSQIKDQLGLANATSGLARAQRCQGEYDKAEESYVSAREIYTQLEDQDGIANTTEGLNEVRGLKRRPAGSSLSWLQWESPSKSIWINGRMESLESFLRGL